MKKYTINVTEDDIVDGIRQNGYKCPIALALKRQFPKTNRIHVNAFGARLFTEKKNSFRVVGEEEKIRPLPLVAQIFVLNYDAVRPVKPFSFELEV